MKLRRKLLGASLVAGVLTSVNAAEAVNSCYENEAYYEFMIDASGSVGEANYQKELDFVSDAITNHVSEDANLAVFNFSDVVIPIQRFWEDQSRDLIVNKVQNAVYLDATTNTQQVIEDGIDHFEEVASLDDQRVIFLITDGNPFPSRRRTDGKLTCDFARELSEKNIEVKIIGIGDNWNPQILSCLVEDPTKDIVEIASFSDLDASIFSTVLNPSDQDKDFVRDCDEFDGDTDLDGVDDYLDPDDDGDGISTSMEDLDGDMNPFNDDTDGDNIPNFLDKDDDGDGILSKDEDSNNDGDPSNDDFDNDGIPDYLDSDPNNAAPVANAGGRQIVFDILNLDGSASTDAENNIASYEWQITNQDDPSIQAFVSGETAEVTDLVKGWYDVILTVTDDLGESGYDTILVASAGFAYSQGEVDVLLADKDDEISSLEQQLLDCQAHGLSLQTQLDAALSLVASLEADVIAKDALIASLQQQLLDCNALVASLQSQLETALNTIQSLQAEIAQKDQLILNLQNQISNLTDLLNTANQTIVDKDALIATLEEKINELNAIIVEKDNIIAAKDAEILALETKLSECEGKLQEALDLITQKDTKIDGLETLIKDLQSQIETLKVELSECHITDWIPGKLYIKGDQVRFEGKICTVNYHSNKGFETMRPIEPVLWAVWGCVQ